MKKIREVDYKKMLEFLIATSPLTPFVLHLYLKGVKKI